MAVLSIPMAQAQLIYAYNGNVFNESYGSVDASEGTHITVTLSVLAPIPPNLSNGSGYCGTASITDGVSTATPTTCLLSTDSNGDITQWAIDYRQGAYPTVRDLYTDLGLQGQAPGLDQSVLNTAGRWIQGSPGIWFYPTAFLNTNALLGILNAWNIQKHGTSLIDQLTAVLTDINNNTTIGIACSDLQSFANHVKAQTGKAITTAQAATIMQYVAAISAGIPGCEVNFPKPKKK
jgi:hypothetical protein